MPRATEKCGCGASIEVITDHDSRLCAALEEWRGGHQHTAPQPDAKQDSAAEHHAEGNNFSATERKGPQLEPYELHGQYRPDSYGSISLKLHPEPETADSQQSSSGGSP